MASVILTDQNGDSVGLADILEAHTGGGMLHKAFSVYVFSPGRRQILIQRRSAAKMLWPLVWANTCCSHPRESETPLEAGERRTQEELGFRCRLTEGPSFVYRAVDPAGRGVEHEHVTILIGEGQPMVHPNPDEVADWKWIDVATLQRDMEDHPGSYAPWFHLGLATILHQSS